MSKSNHVRKILAGVISLSLVLSPLQETFCDDAVPPIMLSRWGIWNSIVPGHQSRVVLIVDLHADPDAQRNISFILRLLEKQGFHYTALEGAAGPVYPALFTSMPDQKASGEIGRYWLKQGLLSGSEVVAISASVDIRLFGIEEPKVYLKSLQSFRDCFKHQPRLLKEFKKFESIPVQESQWIENLWTDLLNQKLDFVSYLRQMLGFLGPSFFFLFPKAIQLLAGSRSAFVDIQEIQSEMEQMKFFARERSAHTQQELKDIRIKELTRLLNLLLRLQMTRSEWDSYLEYTKKANLSRCTNFSQLLRASLVLSDFKCLEINVLMSKNWCQDKGFRSFLNKMKPYERFYRLSRERDRVLSGNIIEWIKTHSNQDLVVVAGGFHVKGITERLRSLGVSLYVVVPHSSPLMDVSNYQNLMLGNGPLFERSFLDFAHSTAAATLAPALKTALTPLGNTLSQEAFMAATMALYEILWIQSAQVKPEEVLRGLNDQRDLWKKQYREKLMKLIPGESEKIDKLTGYFDDFNILEVKKKDDLFVLTVRLFGFETNIKISVQDGSLQAGKFDISFFELAPFRPFSFLFKAQDLHAVIRRSLVGHFPKKLNVRMNSAQAIRDYASVYDRAVHLRMKLSEGVGWKEKLKSMLASSHRPALQEYYGIFSKRISEYPKFLNRLKKEFRLRGVEAEIEMVEADDPRIQNRILSTHGSSILVHPEARIGDLLMFFPHEMAHVAGGSELDARRQDMKLVDELKDLAVLLKKVSKEKGVKDPHYLSFKADLLELEALDLELDFHTAKLELLPEGQSFLKRYSLGRLEDVSPEILESMSRSLHENGKSVNSQLEIKPFWQVLSDEKRPVLERRKRFDFHLIRFLIRQSMDHSVRAFVTVQRGQQEIAETGEEADDQRLKSKTRWNISRGFIYILISAMLAGLTPIIGKELMTKFPTFSVLLVRELIVAVLLTPFIISKKIPNPTWKQALIIALLSFFFTGIGDPLYYEGLRLTSPLAAFLIFSTGDLFLMVLASRYIFKEKLSVRKWLGAALTLLGAFMIAFGEAAKGGRSSLIGAILVFASAAVATVWTILAKKILKNVNPIVMIAITFWAGVPIFLVLAGASFAPIFSPWIWVMAIITAVVYILYYKGLKWISALTVTLVDLTSPMFTALFSAIHKLKFPSLSDIGALIITTLGILTFVWGSPQKKVSKRKVLEGKADEWMSFGKQVFENLESMMMADEGVTLPSVVDVSDLEEEHGPADVLEALSYYVHKSDVPNKDVFDIIFKRLGSQRALKLLLDAKESLREYLKGDITDAEKSEELEVLRTINEELARRFSVNYSQMIRIEGQKAAFFDCAA